MTTIEVSTKDGRVSGQQLNGISVWKGIPYAKPPVDELRFAAPVPPERWEGVKEAFHFGPENIQPRQNGAELELAADTRLESEDCLYLNVWAPESAVAGDAADASLPVMVWIHGGSFLTGAGSWPLYDGSELAKRGNIVVVTINYRLGPFGFLHLAPLGGSFVSNAGLLDQIAALEWVKNNIAAFGGDPAAVTIFGESAGSMSIAALLSMAKAKGLFSRAIMQSGASQIIPQQQADGVRAGLLQLLGISPSEPEKLRAVPAEQIFAAGEKLKEQAGDRLALLFQPVLDEATLPQSPLEAIQEGAAADIPLLIGTNLDEGHLFIRPDMPYGDNINMSEALTIMAPDIKNVAAAAAAYPPTSDGQAQMMTEAFFWRSSLQFATAQSEYAPVWMYRFDWVLPEHPLLHKSIHGIEIFFVFNTLEHMQSMGVMPDESMRQLAWRMQDAWIAFAKQGTPETDHIAWPVYSKPERSTFIFNHATQVISDPDAHKRELLEL
ncbi:carboxylesterase/lipase family protein [Paenibacillus sp. KS-LC4]|uniref:carboxylesterase/lipase family protein n=1 Tax=Paenibacillus sp. KS-LC4 TaxID=2979727 RepID=UPI0030D0B6A1